MHRAVRQASTKRSTAFEAVLDRYTLADLVGSGRIKLYTTESNVAEAWTRKENDPAWRIGRHIAFERYVVEMIPSNGEKSTLRWRSRG